MDHNLIILSFLFIVTVGLVAQEKDDTLEEFASGTHVVEAVSTKIDSSCIFQDDKELLRRIAYVETTDGHDKDTFTSHDHKGIWKMSESMFGQSMLVERNILEKIQHHFEINWLETKWQDIQKPLYAGLAVRLYLLVTAKNKPIPREVKQQAQYWKMYYNSKDSEQIFIDKVSNLEKGCSHGLADVVFLMDSSGSIGIHDFRKMKQFLKDVIAMLNVGPSESHTRVSVVSFANDARPEFNLDSYQTVEQYHRAIDSIEYLSQGTYTNLALKYLVDKAFSLGGRSANKGVPKLVITLTDGMSTLQEQTLKEAKRAHNAGINMISIGIGSSVKDDELTAMASEPTCRHKFLLNEFSELDLIKDIIEKKSCEAPIILKPGDDKIETPVPAGGSRQCKIEVTANGTTITVHPTDKGLIKLYLSRTVYPNPANFEKRLIGDNQHPAVEFLPGSPDKVVTTEYCLLEGEQDMSVNVNINLKEGNHNPCHENPCQNGGKCKNVVDGKFECECPWQFTGQICEIGSISHQGFNCQNNNPCTIENIAAGKFYFPHAVKEKFVQCDEFKGCFEVDCLPGERWNPDVYTCMPF